MKAKFFSLLIIFFLAVTFQKFQTFGKFLDDNDRPSYLLELMQQNSWVDSVFKTMNPDERIGQLFMIAAYSNKDQKHIDTLAQLIKQYNIGGLEFLQGGPFRQAMMCNELQKISKIPMLISMDAEWGLAMRLDSTMQFPHQIMLGAISDDKLIYEMGREIGRQCKRLGMHINFAPVIDINNNPNNPVINDRSFGENKMQVTQKGLAYMKGMQDEKVLACAKHFPGHGDTDKDSHNTLPTILASKERMDSLELFPFRELINKGVGSIMTAHLNIPSLDSNKMTTSLSKNVVTNLLKTELKFEGLIFTDALNMKGVSNFFEPGKLDLKALLAGNDVLLFSEDVPIALKEIKNAIDSNLISQNEIDERVKKILKAKYWVGLSNYKPIDLKNLYEDLNNKQAELLNRKLIESALTVVRNKNNFFPFKNLDTLRFASVSIGSNFVTPFQEQLEKYAPFTHFQIRKTAKEEVFDSLLIQLKDFNTVIVGLHDLSRFGNRGYGVSENSKTFIEKLQWQTNVVIVDFGNPYSLQFFEDANWLLLSYEDNKITESLSAQLLFGGISAKGNLPVSTMTYKYGTGSTTPTSRLKYSIPEEVGISSVDLKKIDSLANDAIAKGATPGCQILVAKDKKIIYQKSFGYQTYDNTVSVKNSSIYDLASVTKIAATTISMMKLVDEEKINLRKKLGFYLPEAEGTNKENLRLEDILTHQAGLRDWIPFYLNTLKNGTNGKRDTIPIYKEDTYSSSYSKKFSVRVAENFFINKNYADTIWQNIFESKLKEKGKYIYSDLGFYLLRKMVEFNTNKKLEDFTAENFYVPLGLTMGFKPREKFPLEKIVPTERDNYWRKQLLQGDVHDMGAAMLGGVSGHAGLFSTANDLAVLMQMLLNKGEYGGKKYFSEKTVDMFTEKQSRKSRRGLGFDKPETDEDILREKGSPLSLDASPETFGHQGFTGTCVWADPKNNLIFVFLSNRVYPTMENHKLLNMNVRTNIQQVIYDAINKIKQ